jgi:hypothetical protein
MYKVKKDLLDGLAHGVPRVRRVVRRVRREPAGQQQPEQGQEQRASQHAAGAAPPCVCGPAHDERSREPRRGAAPQRASNI